ncbi:hypothetical protein NWP22_09735 [Anabaenopsis tanganyikae CS-531]|uniref:Glycosyltransferase n=1 Tax=Anabaenopsis tanganyikae CS-531 TaxID=2785304 RepID=A0ABT6KE72_9CYAN|nr:hypothetical protein [Anabaenopsis tanganyikae]MDH6106143.1 hypothetical protein [Anabaenopsis tanganyikae CS-531]
MTKTLIVIGSVVPGGANVGEILLRDMLTCLKREEFIVAPLLTGETFTEEARGNSQQLNTIFPLKSPPEHAVRRWGGRLGGLVCAGERLLFYDRQIKVLVSQIEEQVRELGITRIWGILNTTVVVDALFGLMGKCDLPLYTQVWDDIDYLTQQRGLDATMRFRTRKRFGLLLKKSVKTGVICETMAQSYKQRYTARCEIIRHGLPNQVIARTEYSSTDEFRIGFSGGMYAPDAWQALFAALAYINWQIADNKPIKLIVMSGKITLPCTSPAHVEYLGWRTTDEVRQRLAECDLLYVPYPFTSYLKPLAQLSFPTKLSTYVNLGRPIFAHVPEYASLVDFYAQYPLGALCTSLDPKVIAEQITALAEDTSLYEASAKTVAWVGEKELSHQNFVKQVKQFIELEPPTS